MRRVNFLVSMFVICLLTAPVVLGQIAIPVPATPPSSFLYAPNASSNTISAYAIDSTTGSLTPIAGSPFAAANSVNLTLDPGRNFGYVGDGNYAVISTFAINSQTGFLNLVNTSPQGYYGASGFALTPDDKFAYVTNAIGVIVMQLTRKTVYSPTLSSRKLPSAS